MCPNLLGPQFCNMKLTIGEQHFAGYTIIENGRACNRITTKEECEEAAHILGLPDTTANEGPFTGPSHCHWYKEGASLWFNTNFAAHYDCTTGHQCLCRGGKSMLAFIANISV